MPKYRVTISCEVEASDPQAAVAAVIVGAVDGTSVTIGGIDCYRAREGRYRQNPEAPDGG